MQAGFFYEFFLVSEKYSDKFYSYINKINYFNKGNTQMKKSTLILGAALLLFGCQNTAPNNVPSKSIQTDEKFEHNFNRGTTIGANVPDVYKKITSATDISMSDDGKYVIIKTHGRPENRKSYYYKSTPWESTLYDSTSPTNPVTDRIFQYGMTFTIPVTPDSSQNLHDGKIYGPMGVTTNGVSIYSPFNGVGAEVVEESSSFDSSGGHPDTFERYHYHVTPTDLTSADPTALVGFMLDGFPVYGPKEADGKTPVNLDNDYYGHFHKTPDYPNGIYHFHVGAKLSPTGSGLYPFTSGYYKGTKGTVEYYPDLNSQDWSGLSLEGRNLTSADMQNGTFTGTNLSGATLTNATLTGAKFAGATWTDGSTICNTLSVGSCTDYESTGVASGNVLAYYKFNGNTTDSSGNGYNATAKNSPSLTTDRISQSNKAYSFDGVDDYMEVPTLFTSSPSQLSTEIWTKRNGNAGTVLFYHGDNGEFNISSTSTVTSFNIKLTNGEWISVGTGALSSTDWSHVVAVWKKGDSMKIYVNGVLKATTSLTAKDFYLYDPGANYAASVGVVNRSSTYSKFSGYIDNIKVYNTALTDSQITEIYNTTR